MAKKSTSFYPLVANEKIDEVKLARAKKIILDLYKELANKTSNNRSFIAAIYDNKGKLIAKAANSVVTGSCSLNHAEINVIREAERILGTYDLSPYHLSLYTSAEPCIMCAGAIIWSGIKEVYYGVPLECIQELANEDQGPKINLLDEFKKRGIIVYGGIEVEEGQKIVRLDTAHKKSN